MRTTKTRATHNHTPVQPPVTVHEGGERDGVANAPIPDELAALVRDRQLQEADDFRDSGALWQAEEMYRILIEDHADSPQAEQARHRLADLSAANDRANLILDRLLRMADAYRTRGALWQAEEMYKSVMDDHADTPQAGMARKRLMDLCEGYERDGQLHHARSLYERLL